MAEREDPVYAATKAQLDRQGLPTHGRVVPVDTSDEVYRATLAEVQRDEGE